MKALVRHSKQGPVFILLQDKTLGLSMRYDGSVYSMTIGVVHTTFCCEAAAQAYLPTPVMQAFNSTMTELLVAGMLLESVA